jgi:uncharacterized protein (DUF2141 family)
MEAVLLKAWTLALLLTGLLATASAQAADAEQTPPTRDKGSVAVRLTGVRNMTGLLHCCLFRSSEGFPDEYKKAYRSQTLKATQKKPVFTFRDLPYGEYAVTVLHDENSNKKLDKGFFGIPREGVGTSKNPKPRMGPPLYRDAAFQVDQELEKLKIKVRYP